MCGSWGWIIGVGVSFVLVLYVDRGDGTKIWWCKSKRSLAGQQRMLNYGVSGAKIRFVQPYRRSRLSRSIVSLLSSLSRADARTVALGHRPMGEGR